MKNKTMKKISALLAATMLIGTLTACGSNGAEEKSEGAASTETTASAETTENKAEESSADKEESTVNLTFGIHVADLEAQEPQTYEVLKAFEAANPDVKLEILATSSADEQDMQMKLAAESGTLPDIFWTQPGVAKAMADAGYLMELSGFLDYDSKADETVGKSLRTVNEDGTVNENGKVYGMPYQKMVTGFWVNKTVFEENDVEMPHNGTTFEEFLEIVKALNEKGITTISNGAKTPYSIWAFQEMFARYGFLKHIGGIREGSDSFVNEDFLNFFGMIDQLRQAGAFPSNITTQDYFQGKEAFLAGNAAMLDSGQWDSAEINDRLGDQVTFWWGPTFANGVGDQKVGMQALTNNLRVSAEVEKDAAKKDAVYRFFSFWLSEEADVIRIQHGTNPLANAPKVETDNKAYDAMIAAMSEEGWSGIPLNPPQIVTESIKNAMNDAIYGVMSGIYTPQEACESIQSAQENQ